MLRLKIVLSLFKFVFIISNSSDCGVNNFLSLYNLFLNLRDCVIQLHFFMKNICLTLPF